MEERMKTIHFETRIAAPRETVWDVMLADETYRDWTSAFAEGSYYEGSWEKGSRIRVLGPGEGGMVSGMVSEIAESRRPEFISIRHLGIVKDGVEDLDGEEARKWAPAYENYTFERDGDATRLRVSLDVTPEGEAMMNDMWPRALERLKALCEARSR
jgi:uncharacterized protein YndB with AHSA1/START domain